MTRLAEGHVVDVRATGDEGATYAVYTVRLGTGELVSVPQAGVDAIAEGTVVLIQYGAQTKLIPQNAVASYS